MSIAYLAYTGYLLSTMLDLTGRLKVTSLVFVIFNQTCNHKLLLIRMTLMTSIRLFKR